MPLEPGAEVVEVVGVRIYFGLYLLWDGSTTPSSSKVVPDLLQPQVPEVLPLPEQLSLLFRAGQDLAGQL